MCSSGHCHVPMMEDCVCDRLTLERRATGARPDRQVKFALLSITPKPTGKAERTCVDVVVAHAAGPWRAIDAKALARFSRNWRLRTAAFDATYGRGVEEVER